MLLIGGVAFLGATLSFYSGFGLGTLLLPVFALFFPMELAVAMTALVHFLNNAFKLALVGRFANLGVLLRFGLPAMVAALLGASILGGLSALPAVAQYQLGEKTIKIETIKLVMGAIILAFCAVELHPRLKNLALPPKYLSLGGLLSGFFGGLSGHQGALRSMFLLRAGLDKQAFLGTGVVIACMVDVGRLGYYGLRLSVEQLMAQGSILAVATAAAFAGAYLGSRFLLKVTIRAVQGLVAAGLTIIALLMMSGLA